MKTGISMVIDRPIEDVFILATDHVVVWSSIVVEDELIHLAEDGGVGTRFRTVTEDRGHRMEFEGEVVDYDPPSRSAILLRGPAFDLDVAYEFESLSNGRTRITQFSRSRGKGIWWLLLMLLTPLMRKSGSETTRKELDQLRIYCESGTPATPGGPSVDVES